MKVAHYFYPDGQEIAIYVSVDSDYERHHSIIDPLAPLPMSPPIDSITGLREPHPSDGNEFLKDYAQLGMYYGYRMLGY